MLLKCATNSNAELETSSLSKSMSCISFKSTASKNFVHPNNLFTFSIWISIKMVSTSIFYNTITQICCKDWLLINKEFVALKKKKKKKMVFCKCSWFCLRLFLTAYFSVESIFAKYLSEWDAFCMIFCRINHYFAVQGFKQNMF